MNDERPQHWAVLTWCGVNDLADTEFSEVFSGFSEDGVRSLAANWAARRLAKTTPTTVTYLGIGARDLRIPGPRNHSAPLSEAVRTRVDVPRETSEGES